MAHAIFAAEAAKRGWVVRVLSAGISSDFQGSLAAQEARLACERHGTPMSKLVATSVASIDLSGARRVFAMESDQVAFLTARSAVASDRVSLIGDFDPLRRGAKIDDPVGQDAAAFDHCYERLRDCIVHYLETTHDLDEA